MHPCSHCCGRLPRSALAGWVSVALPFWCTGPSSCPIRAIASPWASDLLFVWCLVPPLALFMGPRCSSSLAVCIIAGLLHPLIPCGMALRLLFPFAAYSYLLCAHPSGRLFCFLPLGRIPGQLCMSFGVARPLCLVLILCHRLFFVTPPVWRSFSSVLSLTPLTATPCGSPILLPSIPSTVCSTTLNLALLYLSFTTNYLHVSPVSNPNPILPFLIFHPPTTYFIWPWVLVSPGLHLCLYLS
jgi:hypothetical protein